MVAHATWPFVLLASLMILGMTGIAFWLRALNKEAAQSSKGCMSADKGPTLQTHVIQAYNIVIDVSMSSGLKDTCRKVHIFHDLADGRAFYQRVSYLVKLASKEEKVHLIMLNFVGYITSINLSGDSTYAVATIANMEGSIPGGIPVSSGTMCDIASPSAGTTANAMVWTYTA